MGTILINLPAILGFDLKSIMDFEIRVWVRSERVGCIALRRQPITQSKILILKLLILKGVFI